MILIGAWDSMDKGLLSLVMMLVAIAIMLLLLRRNQFRHATRRDVAREQFASLRDQQRLHQSMDELLVQLEEVSRRVSAQVDTKFAKMECVIRDADERIARLERLLGKRDAEPASPPPVDRVAPAGPIGGAASRNTNHRAGNSAEASANSTPPPPRLSSPSPRVARSAADSAPADNNDPRHQHVYDLIDAGHSPIQAAEALSMPLGEVELILNLRRYR